MDALKNVLIIWRGQLRAKGVQYLMLVFLALIVGIGFYGARITEAYIFKKWTESAQYVDVIVSRKGSPLQIVANTLFRLENPTGNIQRHTVEFWENHPMTASSCPVSLGDNISGYPLIGTSMNYYEWMNIELEKGDFPSGEEDVVLDHDLAKALGLQIGDTLHSSHGASSGETHHHHLQIVGLVRAERAADQSCFFTTTSAYYGMHSANHSDEITALMLRLKSKSALVMLPRVFDSRADEQGAFPVFIFAQLQKQWAPVLKNLESYSILVPVVLLILFMLVVLYLGNTERITQRFLFLQKRSTRHILMYCHGLALIMVILGSLISYIVLRGTFNFYNHHEDGLVLLPICLSIIIFTILSRRK